FSIMKMTDAPGQENLSEEERNRAMHVAIRFPNNQLLMASDILPSAGHVLQTGNYSYISFSTDTREEADRIFQGLSEGGNIEMPMQDMFWGDYFGSFIDKFGIGWMINFNATYTSAI